MCRHIAKTTETGETKELQTKKSRTQLTFITIRFNLYKVKNHNHTMENKKQSKYKSSIWYTAAAILFIC